MLSVSFKSRLPPQFVAQIGMLVPVHCKLPSVRLGRSIPEATTSSFEKHKKQCRWPLSGRAFVMKAFIDEINIISGKPQRLNGSIQWLELDQAAEAAMAQRLFISLWNEIQDVTWTHGFVWVRIQSFVAPPCSLSTSIGKPCVIKVRVTCCD